MVDLAGEHRSVGDETGGVPDRLAAGGVGTAADADGFGTGFAATEEQFAVAGQAGHGFPAPGPDRGKQFQEALLRAAWIAELIEEKKLRALSVFGGTWREYGAVTQAAVLLLAAMVAWNVAGREDSVKAMLRAVAAAAMASGAYGIAQYFGWDPLHPAAAYRVGEGIWTIVRPPGTMGYASYFATWLLMAVFLSVALAQWETRTLWRRMAAAAAAVALVAMLLTGTRAAVLGLGAGGALWVWWSGYRIPRRVLAGAAMLAVCGVAFYISPPGRQLRSRVRWFVEDPWGGARPLLWRDSFRMGIRRPVAGFGPEVFSGTFPHFESKELAEAYPNFAHESPHNMFLDALVSQGIPGLIVLLGLCGAGFAAAWRLRRRNPQVAACLAAALTAGIVSQQFTAMTVPTAVLFFTTIGLAVGLTSKATPSRPNIAWVVEVGR